MDDVTCLWPWIVGYTYLSGWMLRDIFLKDFSICLVLASCGRLRME